MKMYRAAVVLVGICVMTGPVMAAGNHEGGHGHASSPAGMPGKAGEVSQMIEVIMSETDDGAMIFQPAKISVKHGETIKFLLRNQGELAHEFVLGDRDEIAKHQKMMEMADGGHGHDTGNAVQLETGASGELVWKFMNGGMFEFACLIPGHYEAGMKGEVHVAGN